MNDISDGIPSLGISTTCIYMFSVDLSTFERSNFDFVCFLRGVFLFGPMVTLASRKKWRCVLICGDQVVLQERFPAPDVINPLLSNLTLSWIKSFS